MPDTPNIVFVLTDDQGYPPIGAHGHPFIRTPAMNEFHSESVRLDQFHSGTTCAPTRAGLLTGHHCNSTGVWHTIGGRSLLKSDEWSLADALRENGYHTGIFGKWHLGDTSPYRPRDRGFEHVVCHGGGGISQQPDWWGNDYFDDTYRVNGTPKRFEGYCTDIWFDEAIRFIEEYRDEPFFCYISTNAPHSPFNVPTEYRDMYQDHTTSERYARFLGMITNIDDNFARLRRHLGRLGIEEDTILIFMSDNGQTGTDAEANQYNAGMRGMKGSPYEGGHRIPCFIRWPKGGIAEGRDVSQLTGYVDFMPTILDLCEIDVPQDHRFHGRSMAPLLRGDAGKQWDERTLVTDTQRIPYPEKWRLSCVMKGPWRLINGNELYNLHSDPAQQKNVASCHPDMVDELREVYEQWWETCVRDMPEETPISIGTESEPETTLRSHDLRNEGGHTVVWNQAQVRRGETCHGWWEINVETPGTYEFELRRWPEEAGHGIKEGISGSDVEFDEQGIEPNARPFYEGGEALDLDTAALQITGLPTQHAELQPDAPGACFTAELPEGRHQLRARFAASDGAVMAAYYVYVRLLEEHPSGK
ncbi:MAG: arylsulfatase [Planctomycetota bacterium]